MSYKVGLVDAIKLWLGEEEYKKQYPKEYKIFALEIYRLEKIVIKLITDEIGGFLPREKLKKVILMAVKDYD